MKDIYLLVYNFCYCNLFQGRVQFTLEKLSPMTLSAQSQWYNAISLDPSVKPYTKPPPHPNSVSPNLSSRKHGTSADRLSLVMYMYIYIQEVEGRESLPFTP